MKATRDDIRVIDLRDRAEAFEQVDTIVLERVQMILLQRIRRKRKLQPL